MNGWYVVTPHGTVYEGPFDSLEEANEFLRGMGALTVEPKEQT